MSNNHNNPGCGNASELVSYLYGETNAAENTDFEKHLAACALCADELAAFSSVKFSVNDWKLKEFADLQTPVIEIPYPAASNKREVSGMKISWLARLRESFSFAPSWRTAAAALAILIVCVGLALFAFDPGSGSDRAGVNKNSSAQISPTAEKTPDRSNANLNQTTLPDPESKPLDKRQTPPTPELTVQPDSTNTRPVRSANPQRRTQKAETTNLPKSDDKKRDDKKKNEIPPKIFEDEEEDDTLRLAEMLEEIDTVE